MKSSVTNWYKKLSREFLMGNPIKGNPAYLIDQ